MLRKLEEATEESLEGEGNPEADIMKQWMRSKGIAKERFGKDLVNQMERAEEKYSRRIATKHLGKPIVRCICAKAAIEYYARNGSWGVSQETPAR